jgi:molybdenum cofactor cytidylyltransferase
MTVIAGIVLGAGSSQRLGRPKQTLRFGPTTLLARVVADVEASALDQVIVVLGGEAETGVTKGAEPTLRPARATVVSNDEYGSGCASSLLAGLDAVEDADAIMLLLGDMPGVDKTVIDAVLDGYNRNPTWAAVTHYKRDRIGHPFLFSNAAFDTLRALHGDKAVWKIVEREPPSRVRRIPVDEDLPRDVDTWDDYLAVCKKFGFQPEAALG